MIEVDIYTDGACSGNPGPGGYGTVLLSGGRRLELSGGFRRTTNNRMELYAIVAGFEALKKTGLNVTIHSDSRYIVDRMLDGAARRWRANGWKRDRKHRAKNPDLWERLLAHCDQHDVTFVWVAGHDGNEENERCDELAVEARQKEDLPADEEFERGEKTASQQGNLFTALDG